MPFKVKKKCLYCEEDFEIFPEDDYKFICKSCYRLYYIPVKHKYTLSEMKSKYREIRDEVDNLIL